MFTTKLVWIFINVVVNENAEDLLWYYIFRRSKMMSTLLVLIAS